MCNNNPPNKTTSNTLITIFVAIKLAATLNGSVEEDKINSELIPRCTSRKRIRNNPARDMINFFPSEELKTLLIDVILK